MRGELETDPTEPDHSGQYPHSPVPDEPDIAWLRQRLQPYRVESLDGAAEGLLTSYYEPVMVAARKPGNGRYGPIEPAPGRYVRDRVV